METRKLELSNGGIVVLDLVRFEDQEEKAADTIQNLPKNTTIVVYDIIDGKLVKRATVRNKRVLMDWCSGRARQYGTTSRVFFVKPDLMNTDGCIASIDYREHN